VSASRAPRQHPSDAAQELRRRPVDAALAVFFTASVAYGLLFSLPEGLGVPVSADSPWPPLRALHAWAVSQEPAHLDPPPILIAHCLLDGLVYAPFGALLVHGLVGARDWIRMPALLYAGSAVTNMFLYFAQTFLGPHPPPHLGTYLAFNLPWLLVPLVLARRMARPDPFGAGAPSRNEPSRPAGTSLP